MSRVILAVLFALRVLLTAASADAQEMTVDVFALPDAAPAAVVKVSEPITCDVFGGTTDATCYPIQPREAGPVAISVDVFELPSKDFETTSKGTSKLEPYVSKPGGYPLRQKLWSGLPKNKLDAVVHLSTGQHAGKYDLKWLASLTWDELNCLHTDDHEGCVSPSAKLAAVTVPGPPKVVPAKPQPQPVTQAAPTQCRLVWNGYQWVQSCR